jgi:hypothetical protein
MLNHNVQFNAVQGGTFLFKWGSTVRRFSILSLDIPRPYFQSLSMKTGHWKHTVLHICILAGIEDITTYGMQLLGDRKFYHNSKVHILC